MKARVPAALVEAMHAHADREAPRECCGVLIGRWTGRDCEVVNALPGRNLATTVDLYELDPEDFVQADKRAGEVGLEVVGFYHSHPRGPDHLSEVDRRQAWAGYLYLLVSGSGRGFTAWIAPATGAPFLPVLLGGAEKSSNS
jgi:proteasome lid subunit RPN8/RPN11